MKGSDYVDQVKIGRFIQSLRKKKMLTQKSLADILNFSDKTISKWETGAGMPDLVFLKPLSDTLGISVNDLLAGEIINEKDIKGRAEENIIKTIDYSSDEINKNKINLLIILLGVVLLTISLLFFSSSGLKAWFSLIAIFIIGVGIYKQRKRYKLFFSMMFILASFSFLLLMDYNNVLNNKKPIFSYVIETKDGIVTYKTLFYNFYRCNFNTVNEYYEIDFSGKKALCTNPFDPNKSDVSRLVKYKNKYLGNNSNTVNLYNALPLSEYGFTTELDAYNLGIIINYNNSEFYVNEDNRDELFVKRSLIYNAISTFLLIDNVEYVEYNFSGSSYRTNRGKTINNFSDYKMLINDGINQRDFNKYLVSNIKNDEFVQKMFELMYK